MKAQVLDDKDKERSDGEKPTLESPRECKQLLKTMILGVKTVVWSVSNSRMAVARELRHDFTPQRK